MKVLIEYCGRWNYKPRAISLIDTLKPSYGSDHATAMSFVSEINEGRTGSFEVEIDDKLVFSKLQEDRFPTDAEIESWKGGW